MEMSPAMLGRWKLAPIVVVAMTGALLLAGLLVALQSEKAYRTQRISAVGIEARVLAATVRAAVAFADREAAMEYLNALRADTEIEAAAIYDASGARFVAYSTVADAPPPDTAMVQEPYFADGRVTAIAPVEEEGRPLGSVYLRTNVEPTERRIARYSGFAVLVTMALLIVLVLGAAQLALSRVNMTLRQRAAELADANARLQAQIEEREKAEEALRQSQKMEAIGQLTGGVAHDFNNLLTIILGNLDRALRRLGEGGDAVQARRAIELAKHGGERAAALTQSLLAFSRRQPLRPKQVDVNKLVGKLSDLLRRTLGEGIVVETVVAGGLWRTHADPNQLENAILNLAVNARDAMPDGGKLTIETANAYLDAHYAAAHDDLAPGQYVVLSITDTGVGMSRQVLEQAFEPFYTTKDVGHGTGLGLSQVYGFVKQSGGHVKIYSEIGLGTTVKIYLPRLLSEEAAEEEPAAPSALPTGHAAEAVLVVEDDEDVRQHSVEMLSELGYTVHQAATGRLALAILARHPEIALLFTDVGLPDGMNGRQLADEASRRNPRLRVLFTTGYARNAIVHDSRLDPGVHLVTKPFTEAQLATALRELLDRAAKPPCILLVEDEPMIRINTSDDLRELGYRVEEAGTAAEGLTKMRLAAGGIDAALIDVGLPDLRGDALAAELRAMHRQLPIVIASGYSDAQLRERFAADPFVSFLGKPYSVESLAEHLRRIGVGPGDPASPG